MGIINVLDLALFTAFFTSLDAPVIFINIVFPEFRNLHSLNHLADGRVGGDENRMAVFFSQIKGFHHKVRVLLNRSRCQYQCVVIPVAAASCELPVVPLTLSNVAKTCADTHNIHDNCRKVCCHQVGDPFLFQ